MLVEPMLDSETYTPGNLKYDVQWYGICDLMSQWMGIGRFLRRKHAGFDENYIYISKSALQVLPSKNEHWQSISGWLMRKRICSWGVFAATHWVHWRTQNRWYWNHNWRVSGGLSIKLGDPVEPPKTWGVEVLQIRVNIGLNHGWLVVSYFIVYMFPCELYILISNFNILSDINILFMFNA